LEPETVLARARRRPWFRIVARVPQLAFRVGLGPVVGRTFMLLTTTGERSGAPRTTMVAFAEVDGVVYAGAAYGRRTQWYRNLLADPLVTVRTAAGAVAMTARPVRAEGELRRAIERLRRRPWFLRSYLASQGLPTAIEELVELRERVLLVAFEPSSEPGPPSPEPDLVWVCPALGAALALRSARRRGR
jgi:deazaflavin-dependent oxidoreductase (nitroreductase family)